MVDTNTSYNTSLICTYKSISPTFNNILVEDDVDNDDTEPSFYDASEILYRRELLQVFNMVTFNNEVINQAINELYNKILKNPEFNECMKILANRSLSDDLEIGLMTLFSYDYFYLAHPCVRDFLMTGQISLVHMNALKSSIGN